MDGVWNICVWFWFWSIFYWTCWFSNVGVGHICLRIRCYMFFIWIRHSAVVLAKQISGNFGSIGYWLKWTVFNFAAMQSQVVCNGCRSLLLYPRGATNVCCALCNTITSVPPPGKLIGCFCCWNFKIRETYGVCPIFIYLVVYANYSIWNKCGRLS